MKSNSCARRKKEMLSMTQKNDIRKKYFEQGQSISEIAKEAGFDRKTVRKVLDRDDWNQKMPSKSNAGRPSKLKPYCQLIDQWLVEDKMAKRKQRHTSRRVYDRLKEIYENEFSCCYKTVANYVTLKKNEIYKTSNCSLPLEHIPGEAQVDFGDADFYENGHKHSGKYLNISFPYSNQGYFQIFKGENQECLFEGMQNIFNHIGGVPVKIWFDNAGTIVKTILRHGERNLTDDFLRFANHFKFEFVFCNPGAGNEKGSVEAKVGYHRRNMLVPVPRFRSIDEYNLELLEKCDADGKREHYKKEFSIAKLYEKDKSCFRELPENDFDSAKYINVNVNTYGKFTLNKGLHEYSTVPKLAGKRILVKVTASTVIVLDEKFKELVMHSRLYGEKRQESMQWLPYLSQLARKPGALKYTGIYGMLPNPLKEYLERCDKGERGKVLQAVETISREAGFDNAVSAVYKALSCGAADPDSIMTVYAYQSIPELDLKPVKVPEGMPTLQKVDPNISQYDAFLGILGDRLC
jgi:transposase